MSLSKWPPGGHIVFWGFRTLTWVWLWISTPNFSGTILCIRVGIYWFSATWFSKCLPGGHIDFSVSGLCRWHGFGGVIQVCFGISVSNFMCMSFVAVGKSLRIFSYVAFKMAVWSPYCFVFCFWTLTLVWLWISSPRFSSTLLIYMGKILLIFSDVTFKMAAQWPYWIFWFPDSGFSLASNIKSKLQ